MVHNGLIWLLEILALGTTLRDFNEPCTSCHLRETRSHL